MADTPRGTKTHSRFVRKERPIDDMARQPYALKYGHWFGSRGCFENVLHNYRISRHLVGKYSGSSIRRLAARISSKIYSNVALIVFLSLNLVVAH